MAQQEIKRTIRLDGEKEFSAALKEANRNLKTLRSELKAETAELGANATAQQKNETRAKSLQKQITEQEKIVKTLQAALAEAKKKYGDNEEVVAKWEQKLNEARATMGNMKNSLEEANQAARDQGNAMREAADGAAAATVATKSAADALGELGGVGENVAGAIENIFFAMISTIESAVSAMFDLVTETAAKTNGWEDIAGYWNTDTQTIQQYARAVAASGNAFEDLNSAVSKLVLGGKEKKIAELLGVSNANYEDQWAYAMAALDQLSELKKSGANTNGIYEEIFGEKKSTKVMDLINDWDTIKGLLDTFNGDKSGFGLSGDALSAMSALHVQVSTVEEKWDALKANFAAGFGTATGKLLVNVEGGLDALADYMNAGTPAEREAALESLRGNVEEFFTKAAEILREGIAILAQVGEELKESDDPATALIGSIITKLTDGLQWLINNQNDVKIAFETIFGAWLLLKLAAVAGRLSRILLQIEAIKAFKGVSLAGAGAAEAAEAAASGGIITKILGGIAKVAPWVAGAYTLLKPGEGDAQQDAFYHEGKLTEAGKEAGLPETQEEWEGMTPEQQQPYWDQMWESSQQKEKGQPYDWTQDELQGEERAAYELNRDAIDRARETITRAQEAAAAESAAAETPSYLTPEQLAAAETLWDIARGAEMASPGEMDKLWEYFEGNDALMDKLDEVMTLLTEQYRQDQEDLPASWWLDAETWLRTGSGENAVTSGDLQALRSLPGSIGAAVKAGAAQGVSGIQVLLDGATVGRLVAPYVSETVARDVVYLL